MVTDKGLLKEVTKELWQSVKKLRPDLGKDPRMQLVLKALITIGDLPNPIEAAMVVATCLEMEAEGEPSEKETSNNDENEDSTSSENPQARRTIRRRSAAN